MNSTIADRCERSGKRKSLLGRSVLLAEREFDQAITAQHALQHAGAKVIGPFADSLSILRALARHTPSCAVVGVDLSEGMRNNVAAALLDKGVPLILVARGQEGLPAEFADLPVLQKPLRPNALVSLVASASHGRWY